MRKLLQAPFTLASTLMDLIDAEAHEAKKGRPARIVAKMNALVEPQIIRALYRASQAGVEIDLLVRGICCLRPGQDGVSTTIRVRSVVGRFLEHSRVFQFHAGGEEIVYCASADWMGRNFYRRVEVCFPIINPILKRRLIEEIAVYLADDTQAWLLDPRGKYARVKKTKGKPRLVAQNELLRLLAEDA